MRISPYSLAFFLSLSFNSYALEFNSAEKGLIQSLSGQYLSIPIDKSNKVSGNPLAIKMGKQLFFSKDLTPKKNFSCASCHIPQLGWADNKKLSKIQRETVNKHTPSLWNVGANRWFFWDGRADTLWAQATQSLEAHDELDSNRIFIARMVITNPQLRAAYLKLFKSFPECININKLPKEGKPSHHNSQMNKNWLQLSTCQKQGINELFIAVTKMIAAFEETIISKQSPFDQFAKSLQLQQVSSALTEQQQQGLKIFIGKAKCISCHSGPNFTDNEFHSIFFNDDAVISGHTRYEGIKKLLKDPFNSKGRYSDQDPTHFNKLDYVYRNIELKGKYKTPSLRNITESAPYMHDGRMDRLEKVIKYYSQISSSESEQHQETIFDDTAINETEQQALFQFLRALTDTRFLSNL